MKKVAPFSFSGRHPGKIARRRIRNFFHIIEGLSCHIVIGWDHLFSRSLTFFKKNFHSFSPKGYYDEGVTLVDDVVCLPPHFIYYCSPPVIIFSSAATYVCT